MDSLTQNRSGEEPLIRTRFLLCCLALTVAIGYIHADNPSAEQVSTFTGEITDSICARNRSHAESMQMSKDMGKTSASCTIVCVDKQGAKFVLFDAEHKKTYMLSK